MNECDCSAESTFKRCHALHRYAMNTLKCGMNNGITQSNDIEIYSVLKWNQRNAFNVPKYVCVLCLAVVAAMLWVEHQTLAHLHSQRVRYRRCVQCTHSTHRRNWIGMDRARKRVRDKTTKEKKT